MAGIKYKFIFGEFDGAAYWVGKNLKVYSQAWGGNGFTGGRNAVQEFAEGMGKVAKPLGVITSVYSGYQAINDFTNGHTEAGLVHPDWRRSGSKGLKRLLDLCMIVTIFVYPAILSMFKIKRSAVRMSWTTDK